MVASEDNHGVLTLAGFVETLNDARQLVVDEGNHRVIKRLNLLGPAVLRRLGFGLKINRP